MLIMRTAIGVVTTVKWLLALSAAAMNALLSGDDAPTCAWADAATCPAWDRSTSVSFVAVDLTTATGWRQSGDRLGLIVPTLVAGFAALKPPS
ncbi:MAG TPA: hypothetical protein VFP72_18840 [Kineosporiaceae bacterium]|nr:hypothetical protein [Kineosporiaceae bacterium]